MKKLWRFFTEEDGLELSEYAVIGAILIAAGAAVYAGLGTQIRASMNAIIVAMGGAAI